MFQDKAHVDTNQLPSFVWMSAEEVADQAVRAVGHGPVLVNGRMNSITTVVTRLVPRAASHARDRRVPEAEGGVTVRALDCSSPARRRAARRRPTTTGRSPRWPRRCRVSATAPTFELTTTGRKSGKPHSTHLVRRRRRQDRRAVRQGREDRLVSEPC
jgi:hypothetical protein